MEKKHFKIDSGILASREKLKDRFLFAGKIAKEGNDNFIFYVIEILSPWFPSTKVEAAITGILQRSFLNKSEYLPEDFENVLQAVNGELGNLSQQGENDWIGNLNALIGFVENNKIHLTMCGTIPAFLISGNRVSNISDGLCSKGEIHPLKTFANITSGGLNENDKIIAGNIRLYDHISIERLRKLFDKKSAKQAAQEIYRFLKKGKIKDANIILMQLVDHTANPQIDEEIPEIFYLDQNEESAVSKLYKVYFPKFVQGLSFAGKNISKAAEGVKKSTAKSGAKISELHQKYSPETKEFLGKSTNAVKTKTHDLLSKVKKSNAVRSSGIKIKSYAKQNNISSNPVWKVFKSIFRAIIAPKNRRYLYATIVILLIFFGYLKIKTNNENKVAVSKQYDIVASVTEAEKLFNEAKEEIGLGKSDGKDKLLQAMSIAKTGEQSEASKAQSIKLQQDIQKEIDEIIKSKSYFDLSPIITLNGDAKGVLVGTTIYSINGEGKLYSTDTKDKEPVLISSIGAEVGKVVSMTFSDALNTIYILTDTNKVLSFDIKNQVVSESKIDDGSVFVTATAISAYSSNIYLLDTTNGKIIKYAKTDTGFAKGASYSGAGAIPAIKTGIDLTIDGNVFMLKNDANISKFSKGTLSTDFSVKGVPSPTDKVEKPKQIASDPDTNNIFLLDQNLNRVIKYDKNSGIYISQYSFPGINVDQFFINPRIQKMWILSGNKIYEINL